MVGIIVVRKRKKSEQHTKPEGVYSTIDEIALQRSSSNKPVYAEMNELHNKEPQHTVISEITDHIKQAQRTTLNNPTYCVSPEQQVKMQDNPAYSTSSGTLRQKFM